MTTGLAHGLVQLAGLYLAVGIAVAIPFVIAGIGRIDPVARDSGWGFRLVVLPGCIALWPFVVWRWIRGPGTPPPERNAHRDAATGNGHNGCAAIKGKS